MEDDAEAGVRAPRAGGCTRVMQRLFGDCLVLRSAPRDLWIIFLLKCLESYGYFSISLSMTKYLSDDFFMSDVEAGVIYGTYGAVITVFGFLVGPLIDCLGVKKALILGGVISVLGRGMFAMARTTWQVYVSSYALMPLGSALGIPVMTIAVKRYSNKENRSHAFGMFYTVMNVAAFLSGPTTDSFRVMFESGTLIAGTHFSAFRLIFLTSTFSTLIMTLVAIFFVRNVALNDHGHVEEDKPQRMSRALLGETLRDSRFWRLMLLSLLLVGARMAFRHLDSTLPKYMVRSFGEKAPYGNVYSINPLLVIALVPIVSARTKNVHPFKLILYGGFVSAGSLFLLCIEDSILMCVLFVIMLSIGEAVYSPATYLYSMLIAPKGKEGLYTSLSAAPLFMAKFGVGMMSGVLLRDYCPPPDQGPCHGRMLWFLIGCTTFSSPVLIWLFRRVIQPGSTSTPMRSAEEEGDREVLTEGVGNLDTQDAYAHLEEASPVEMATCASPGSPCSLSSVDSSSSTRSVGQR